MDIVEQTCKEKVEELIACGKITYQQILSWYGKSTLNEVKKELNMRLTKGQMERQMRDEALYAEFKATGMTVTAYVTQKLNGNPNYIFTTNGKEYSISRTSMFRTLAQMIKDDTQS